MAATFHDIEALAINLESQERRELVRILLTTFRDDEFELLRSVWERESARRNESS